LPSQQASRPRTPRSGKVRLELTSTKRQTGRIVEETSGSPVIHHVVRVSFFNFGILGEMLSQNPDPVTVGHVYGRNWRRDYHPENIETGHFDLGIPIYPFATDHKDRINNFLFRELFLNA
jgi:hypothetical protein